MMRYTVTWNQAALNELASLWMDLANDRQAITKAADAIDSELAENGASKGSQISADLREITIEPLVAVFSASRPDRLIRVVRVIGSKPRD